jgi:hypothetical protein
MNSQSIVSLLLAVSAVGGPSPYMFGPLARRLSRSDVAVLVDAAGTGQAAPIALFAYPSQVLPETWFADLFLPAKAAGARLRRGAVVHLRCAPVSGRCQAWQITSPAAEYVQTVVSDRESAAAPEAIRPLDRPIVVEGGLTDEAVLSLIEYVRSGPEPPKSADGGIGMGLCACYPILSIRQEPSGDVRVVTSADGGVGLTAVFRRTQAGWKLVESVGWVL